ncbi:MAG TPA: TorF family putative porin [Rhodocyclaceae bacterium]
MQKKIISAVLAGAMLSPLAALADDAPASPLSFNIGVTSDYLFRGVSQTHGKPALQGGVDYAFSNGFYVGAWASNITWVKDFLGSGSTEVDVYGGYKGAFANPDWTYDVGYITYNYPGHGSAIQNAGGVPVLANPNTQELYGSIGWKWLSAKYSYATSSHFIGWYGSGTTATTDDKTRGSSYLELNANYDMGGGWTLIGHLGHQKVKNITANSGWTGPNNADYTDWKLGVSKDVGFGTVTLAYSDTNTKGTCTSTGGTNLYCWANGNWSSTTGPTTGFRDVSKGTAVLSFLKTF